MSIRPNEAEALGYLLMTKLRDHLNHFSDQKLKYKLLSLTWLIASFIGYGYILSEQEIDLPIDGRLSLALISALAAFGLSFIWVLDVLVYHRQVDFIMSVMLRLEEEWPALGRSYHNILNLVFRGATGPVILDGIFYSCMVTVLLIIGSIAVISFCKTGLLLIIASILCVTTIIGVGLSIILFSRHSTIRILFFSREESQ